jgi:hypothetical protein
MAKSEHGLEEKTVHLDGVVVHSILMSIPEAARSGSACVCRSSLEQWVQQREYGA